MRIGFMAALLSIVTVLAAAQAQPGGAPTRVDTAPPATAVTTDADDIVRILMPEGFPTNDMHLSALPRQESVERLHEAQKTSTGKRAQQVAFLLATFDEDYDRNRKYLKDAIAGCAKNPPDQGCDSDTAAFVIDLYRRGDITLLPSIIAAGHDSKDDLADTLGDFYATLLAGDTVTYLYQVQLLPVGDQEHVCRLAGENLGSDRDVAEKMSSAPGSLAKVGERCLVFVRQGIAAPVED